MKNINRINQQYLDILTKLKILNPEIGLDYIKNDLETLIYKLFIKEFEEKKFSKEISYDKIRKHMIKQKLQSFRQPSRLRDIKDVQIKKETKHLRFKKIQDSLIRKDFFDKLDYPGTFSKKEIIYINHTDKTYEREHQFDEDKKQEQKNNEKFDQELKATSDQKIMMNEIDVNNFELINELPEIQETIDIFKRVEEKEKSKIEDEAKIYDLEPYLRDKILKLDLKPISKEKREDINLLEYIGFVDKDESSIDN